LRMLFLAGGGGKKKRTWVSILVQPEEVLAGNGPVGLLELASADRWGARSCRPIVRVGQVGREFEVKVSVIQWPRQDDIRGGWLDGEFGAADFKSADVTAIAAGGIGDGSEVEGPRLSPLVSGQAECIALIQSRTARQQGMGKGGTSIISQGPQQGLFV